MLIFRTSMFEIWHRDFFFSDSSCFEVIQTMLAKSGLQFFLVKNRKPAASLQEAGRCSKHSPWGVARKIHVNIINLYSSESPCNSNTWLHYSERHSDEHISRKSKKTVSFARSSWKLYLRLYSYSIIYVEFDSNTPKIISHRFHEKIMLRWKFMSTPKYFRASYKIHVTILWECRSTVLFTQNLILMLPESYLIEFMKKIILGWKNLCKN